MSNEKSDEFTECQSLRCQKCNSYFLVPLNATFATLRAIQADHICRPVAFVAQKKGGER